MRLTSIYKIEIGEAKLTGYLLNFSHQDGWSKAKYFSDYQIVSSAELQKLLLSIISENKIVKTIQTKFGLKYIVDGKKENIHLRTVWVVLNGENICKFVTAYPL